MGNGKTTDLAPVLCLSLPRKPNPNRSNSARRRSPGTNQSRVCAPLNETAVNVFRHGAEFIAVSSESIIMPESPFNIILRA